MSAPWQATVLTIFPEMLPGPLGHSLAGKALADGIWSLETVNPRDFATDRHKSVDDIPFGGGAGMVMRPEVIAAALDHATGHAGADTTGKGNTTAGRADMPRLFLTPRGRPLTQERVERLAQGPGVVVLCGRFEGVDQRVVEARSLEEVGFGDFVMSGGEPAAIALLDACVRLLPGVMGATASLNEESFKDDLLEYPQFTRPQTWEGLDVPEVLLSGHHVRIRAWRRAQAEQVTKTRRPDLWARHLKRPPSGDPDESLV
jgi:tRNA (guanine37-N1)-methyltransferase